MSGPVTVGVTVGVIEGELVLAAAFRSVRGSPDPSLSGLPRMNRMMFVHVGFGILNITRLLYDKFVMSRDGSAHWHNH